MLHKYKDNKQAGFAHLAIVIVLFVVIAGALGFVAYNAMHKNQADAQSWSSFLGGSGSSTTNNKASTGNSQSKSKSTSTSSKPGLPDSVTVTFKPSDWTLSKYAKLVNDPEHGPIVQINKVGMEADAQPLATIPADAEQFDTLAEFHKDYVANLSKYVTNYDKDHYVRKFCVSSQQTYSNQKWSKFPYVSTYQTRVGELAVSGRYDGTGTYGWHANECRTDNMKGSISNLSLALQGKIPLDDIYKQYPDGFKITTKTEVPASGNPAANGTIKVGDVSVTYTYDYK